MARRALFITALVLISLGLIAQNKADFTGTFNMDNGKTKMVLVQKGDRVTGDYSGQDNGKLEGTVVQGKLTYTWIQTTGEKGKGWFTLSSDGKSISGRWGNGASDTDGGDWKGVRN